LGSEVRGSDQSPKEEQAVKVWTVQINSSYKNQKACGGGETENRRSQENRKVLKVQRAVRQAILQHIIV